VTREQELGRLLQEVGRRMEDRGQQTSQRFHDWKRIEQIESDSTRGGGGVEGDVAEKRADRQAARLHKRWTKARLEALRAVQELDSLISAAEAPVTVAEKHRTAAQVEADGWCGHCWRMAAALVPIGTRPSGEPWYRGRCRDCGRDKDPPLEVVLSRVQRGKHLGVPA
jgi:hypothetical protein